jgi:hypothetical protein
MNLQERIDWLLSEAVQLTPADKVFQDFMLQNRGWIEQLNKGYMYCGFFSELLRQKMRKARVKAILLGGVGPKNPMVIKRIRNEGGSPKGFGHAVVLVDDNIVYDPTAMQFNGAEKYDLKTFKGDWQDVNYKLNVRLDDYDAYKNIPASDLK